MIKSSIKNLIAKNLALLSLAFICTGVFIPLQIALADTTSTGDCVAGTKGCDYIALTTIPGATKAGVVANPFNIIKNFYGVAIGIAAVLAVIMIIWAGVEYATVESIQGHSDAKGRWTSALYGLGLLLVSYLILKTINIDLVNVTLDLGSPKACTPDKTDAAGNTVKGTCVGANVLSQINDRAAINSQALQKSEVNIATTQKKVVTLETNLAVVNEKLTGLNMASPEARALVAEADAIKSELAVANQEIKAQQAISANNQIGQRSSTAISSISNALGRGSLTEVQNLTQTAATLLYKDLENLKKTTASAITIQKAGVDVNMAVIFGNKALEAVNLLDSSPVYSQDGIKTLNVEDSNKRKDIITSLANAALAASSQNIEQTSFYQASVNAITQAFDKSLSIKLACGPKGIDTSGKQISCAK